MKSPSSFLSTALVVASIYIATSEAAFVVAAVGFIPGIGSVLAAGLAGALAGIALAFGALFGRDIDSTDVLGLCDVELAAVTNGRLSVGSDYVVFNNVPRSCLTVIVRYNEFPDISDVVASPPILRRVNCTTAYFGNLETESMSELHALLDAPQARSVIRDTSGIEVVVDTEFLNFLDQVRSNLRPEVD
ncbi:hypothetical protein B0T17DRAFT_617562 [Bombardia bombarda]|uniref:Uncharacterized protein n=1 Tax=Bombardia bombarda TaxID=252184 RepID=A0AA40C5J8_9PEZI|nr:hypothetical protein B0T17DRAFT_617562 [Bombardia bombarda]